MLKNPSLAYVKIILINNGGGAIFTFLPINKDKEILDIITSPHSYSFKAIKEKQLDYEVIKIGLERPREELYSRINQRVDQMLESGLLSEVEALKNFENHNALQTVGYKEVFGYFKNEYDFRTMVELLKRNTRRYAKRQLTWFKNQDTFEWFDAGKPRIAEDFILKKLGKI